MNCFECRHSYVGKESRFSHKPKLKCKKRKDEFGSHPVIEHVSKGCELFEEIPNPNKGKPLVWRCLGMKYPDEK